MRTLREFLIAEAKESETESDTPKGYEPIEMRGRITNQLKELLKEKGIDLNLKSDKASKSLNAIRDPEKLLKDLKITGTTDFLKLFQAFAKSQEMKGVFTGVTEKDKIGGKDAIKVQLSKGFESLAGRRNSTLKFIKFWCTSTAIAAGINIEVTAKYEYLVQKTGNIMIIVSDK